MATAKTEPRPVRIPSLSALWRRKPKVLDQWVAPIEAHQQEAEAEEEQPELESELECWVAFCKWLTQPPCSAWPEPVSSCYADS